MLKIMLFPGMIALVAIGTACGAVSPPSALDHATILAVRADPPRIERGARSKIDVLISQADGTPKTISDAELSIAGMAGAGAAAAAAPANLVQTDEAGSWLVAPSDLPEGMPVVVTIRARVNLGDRIGEATKNVILGATAQNPVIGPLVIGDQAVSSDHLEVAAGTEPHIGAACDGDGELRYAWFSSIGDLDFYRSPETVLKATTPKTGVLVLVVRDNSGGTQFKIVDAEVK